MHKGRREYTLRTADAGDGRTYNIAVLRQIEQGNGEALDAARDLLDDLNPSLLLVVGIAGGLPSDDYTLGDVILSTRVNDYNVEARKYRSKPTYNLSGGPIEKRLQAGIANLAARKELEGWSKKLPDRPRPQWKREGHLYGPKRWTGEVAEKLESHFGRGSQPRKPLFMAGPIATSDKLVKDPRVLIPWAETARHMLAIDMESGGVYRAARDRCPMLAIRGISDIVGLKRNDQWTKFACTAAAVFARAYLRTQPVTPKSAGPGNGVEDTTAIEKPVPAVDTLYMNLLPLASFPETVFVAPATCFTYEQAWAMLLEGEDRERISSAWCLYEKNLYSFDDPSKSRLSRIVDTSAAEAHRSIDFAFSPDPEKRRLFVQLLNRALKDDLGSLGVWYHHDDDVYAFAGKPDQPERMYRFQNLRVKSAITVVSHYTSVSKKDGRKFPYQRHLAFSGRFRYLDGKYFLEINPTYRFMVDGKKKYIFHDKMLSGIKRFDGNRAVLSQLLLWAYLLTTPTVPPPVKPRWLTFGKLPTFEIEQPIADHDLTAIDAPTSGTFEPAHVVTEFEEAVNP